MPEVNLSEHQEQAVVIEWFDKAYPIFAGRLVATPNGANLAGNAASRAKQMNKLKREGLRPGYPDLHLPIPSGRFHGLFIEMKRKKGGTLSPQQKDWIRWLDSQGYAANVCKGADAAMDAIKAYINGQMCGTCWLEHGKPGCKGDHYRDALND